MSVNAPQPNCARRRRYHLHATQCPIAEPCSRCVPAQHPAVRFVLHCPVLDSATACIVQCPIRPQLSFDVPALFVRLFLCCRSSPDMVLVVLSWIGWVGPSAMSASIVCQRWTSVLSSPCSCSCCPLWSSFVEPLSAVIGPRAGLCARYSCRPVGPAGIPCICAGGGRLATFLPAAAPLPHASQKGTRKLGAPGLVWRRTGRRAERAAA